MKVEVTAQVIQNGRPGEATCCPIAHAALRTYRERTGDMRAKLYAYTFLARKVEV